MLLHALDAVTFTVCECVCLEHVDFLFVMQFLFVMFVFTLLEPVRMFANLLRLQIIYLG